MVRSESLSGNLLRKGSFDLGHHKLVLRLITSELVKLLPVELNLLLEQSAFLVADNQFRFQVATNSLELHGFFIQRLNLNQTLGKFSL